MKKIQKGDSMEWIQSVDFAILDFIQQFIKNTFLDIPMMIFSYVGEAGACWIVLGIVLCFFKKSRATGVILLASMALTALVGEIALKHLIARPRPFWVNPDITLNISAPSGYSFPSGHSGMSAAAVTVLLARERKRIAVPALVLGVLIVFSRLYNYVHYPSDVICGILLGVLCALIMLFVFRRTGLDRRLSGDRAAG